jgi:hypothetical protein
MQTYTYNFAVFPSPQPAGYYEIGGLRLTLHRRPSWLARLLCRWLLEWEWHDGDPYAL